MKHLIHILALTLGITAGHASAETFTPAMRSILIEDAVRPMEAILWYPTAHGAPMQQVHRNGVWVGVEVANDAQPMAGAHPLVILSHGMYGNARNQNWLAVELVKAGYIVASLNHPGTSTRARDPDDARQIWERAKDVTRAIDSLLENADLSPNIDPARIFMAGHSLGGMTGAQLAGARYDPAQIDATCAADPGALICEIIELWQLGKTPADRAAIAQDLHEPRIKGFALLDPGASQVFSAQSLGAIRAPVLVIGAPKDAPGALDLNVEARALIAQLAPGNATYIEPESLSHFDFLGLCTERAIPILESETPGDGMVCVDGTNERVADHAIIAKAVIDFFAAR